MEIASIYPANVIAELENLSKTTDGKSFRLITRDLHAFLLKCQTIDGPKVWVRLYHEQQLAFWIDDTVGNPKELSSEPARKHQVSVRSGACGDFNISFTLPNADAPWNSKTGYAADVDSAAALFREAIRLCEPNFVCLEPYEMT